VAKKKVLLHIALFMDQHPHSLGGVQTSVLLQKKYLNRSGVRVTVFAPKSKRAQPDPDIKVLPSNYFSIGREYSVVWSLRAASRFCEKAYESQKFDLVHLQGDFAAASLASKLAKTHNLPLVYTSHTNVDVMANKAVGKPLKVVLLRFFTWQFAHFLEISNRPRVSNAWEYMAFIHRSVDKAIAPSNHFAKLLQEKGVIKEADVIITGVDDDLLNEIKRTEPIPQKPIQFVWAGRMQPEKRLLQAIEAFAKAKTNAHMAIYGFGPLEKVAKRLVQARGLTKKIKFQGKLKHKEIIQVFANADVVMQTSIDFETQGLTVYEAAAVGTPTLLCDSKISAELPKESNWVDESGTIEGLSKTIRRAYKDIEAGKNKRAALDDSAWLRQSEISKRTIALYQELIAGSADWKSNS
jgi:1,2-diacylglycerol 3-alpha-glucosyltransferase